ncbi:uncharacterized protein LOC123312596 [Coccinella septempunctata]|uniref:uncharacterized protein LOC123312596 n=1 Tax=Coccinella septempunctata TaxID=41139 RepID=UPI001D07F894|nr:uncharacterized protein LOC123312596 [Coccinella septempunctata]XP_044753043.1 uncharacterized protein LOC123312596 [Coccinella septempunctata]XP_044753044.1 uncharacterized protein LOC123312596 [Coccinella septempunctata]
MVLQTGYFRTFPGILKVFEVIFSTIGLLMTIIFNKYSNVYFTISHIYTVISAIALGATLFLMLLYFLNMAEVLQPILNYQKYFHLIFMMFVLSYSSILLYNGSSYIQLILAGFSGILLAIAFLADGIHGFNIVSPLPLSS